MSKFIKITDVNEVKCLINKETITSIFDNEDYRRVYCDAGGFNFIDIFLSLDELEGILQ